MIVGEGWETGPPYHKEENKLNFDAFAEEFAELVATKVYNKIRTHDLSRRIGGDTFNTPGLAHHTETKNVYEGLAGGTTPVEVSTPTPVLIDFPDQDDVKPIAETKFPEVEYKRKRVAELSKINIRTLRNNISAAEDEPKEKYDKYSKEQLIEYIINFEALIGRTIEAHLTRGNLGASPDEVEDDTDLSPEDEPEDDTDLGELSREDAEKLNLKELKAYAVSQGVPEADLRGLDIDAVLDLLFKSEAATEAPEGSEDEATLDITVEEIKAMSLGELKKLADELIDMGAEINYDRSITTSDLLAKILELVEEE